MTNEFIQQQRSALARICTKHDISYLGLFGSYARGEQREDSDIDLLVDFDARKTLFGVMRAKIDFEDLLGREVDVAIRKNLKPLIRPYIEQDLVTLYEKR